MPKLQPAGFFGQVVSSLFPKEMTAHVRTEILPNGQVQVVPVFTIGGDDVPAEMVGDGSSQTILGHNVTLDAASRSVQQRTQGKVTRLSKKKAVEFLTNLHRDKVTVRSHDGKLHPQIAEVKPNVELSLQDGDTLKVESKLVLPNGGTVPKPDSLEQVRQDEGWFTVGNDLVKVGLTDSPLDEVLIPTGATTTLTGDAVPKFLKLVEKYGKQLGDVKKMDSVLQQLTVFGDKVTNGAQVDGSADVISISPTLVFHAPTGRLHVESESAVGEFERKGGGFHRVPEGWVEVTPETLERHKKSRQELDEKLGDLRDIRGSDIPNTLIELSHATPELDENWSPGSERLRIATEDHATPGLNRNWSSPWTVYFTSDAVKNAHRVIDTSANVEFRFNVVDSDGRSLLELDPIYNHERFKVSHNETEQAVTSGENWVRRRDAWIKVDADKFREITAAGEKLGLHRSANGFTFPASERERVIELFSVLGSIQHSEAFAAFLLQLADFEKIEDVPLPASLRPEIQLRPYQKHGFNWLAFLHRFGLNGILADDMGLGKTLQTLAVIARARDMTQSRFPTLIICPTSVVNNWKAEAQKFFTNTCVITYTGSNRELKLRLLHEMLAHAHRGLAGPLVLTSYETAKRDVEKLNRIPWLYVVVDEGHNIKNPNAERSKAIKTINGQHKLALTGTPIQNNLEELWSLFDFAMPGFLGTKGEFAKTYDPDGKLTFAATLSGKAPLKERTYPFILRRLKATVAKDLPPKTVVLRSVELTPRQVELYKQVIASTGKTLVDEVNRNGVGRSHLKIIEAYTKLRSICNHPVLANPNRNGVEIKCEDSGKLDCLQELMEEVLDGEHRALLFCQSTQMLDIIEDFFGKWKFGDRKIRTLRLDGSNSHRGSEMQDQFNWDVTIQCFLISTKAGGTGLNLTGADTVIFYDHDWNPANDRQAEDRAYRIGAKKPVTVYKLISKGTIEEKILERQAIKQTLADQVIGTDEEGFKDLTKEDLLALFKLDEQDN